MLCYSAKAVEFIEMSKTSFCKTNYLLARMLKQNKVFPYGIPIYVYVYISYIIYLSMHELLLFIAFACDLSGVYL